MPVACSAGGALEPAAEAGRGLRVAAVYPMGLAAPAMADGPLGTAGQTDPVAVGKAGPVAHVRCGASGT